MPSTSYTDVTMGANTIGARTDSGGSPVTDLSAEEARYPLVLLGEGYLTPADSFLPEGSGAANMIVKIGSGDAKTDYYVVAGEIAGQGNYMVRLASATEDVTLDAADGSLDRIDEIYLVVQDDAYDSSGNALPRLAYRKGDAAGSPSAPGADSNWDASVLLATIDVPAGAADITECTVTDERLASTMTVQDASFADVSVSGDITVTGTVDGVNLAAHDHDGTAAGGPQIDAGDLTGLKTAVDAAGVDADTLDGVEGSGYTPIAHVGAGTSSAHPDAIASGDSGFMTGADKAKLDGIASGATANQTITAGSGIDVTGGSGSAPEVAHEDTSSAASQNNSGATVIQDVTIDGFGHVTAMGTKTLSYSDVGAASSGHNHNGDYYTYEGSSPKITISSSGPSGGSNGDIWFEY